MEVSKEIVSNDREDEPLIFISNRAISLYKDNKILKARIDKAIEYIKRYEQINGYYDSCYDGEYDTYSYDNVKEKLLDILKGINTNVKD